MKGHGQAITRVCTVLLLVVGCSVKLYFVYVYYLNSIISSIFIYIYIITHKTDNFIQQESPLATSLQCCTEYFLGHSR